ncbi:MAG: 1-acyl-sn-glycerol-3-phosphate acyltransferase [Endozoicomonas sp. (ex Botrylloides leachii)]|nr:1-acyl-sn-glycerol-3-phosphate acyltransferase [Endozoicomonas sp. (ex Botrylloides leachii)]
MEQFDEIRPYHNEEVRPTLNRLLADSDFINTLARHSYPVLTNRYGKLMEWLTGLIVRYKLHGVNDVHSFQEIIEPFLNKVLKNTASKVTFSGIENLKKARAYLFLSNHRDIVLDPALVNYGIYHHGMETLRIAIGDNLLSRPFVSDLMRLNKSFIVRRSISGRKEKLQSYKKLSAYIHHSISNSHSIWLAHSEGRAKDGNDKTDTAIIKMLYMSKRGQTTSFPESICHLHIVPVAISYEYDPCDQQKAAELYSKEQSGCYQKAENEDINSIATGIKGYKGHIHVAFGTELNADYHSPADVAEAVDQQIYQNYKLHPSNFLAWEQLQQNYPNIKIPDIQASLFGYNMVSKRQEFQTRLNSVPKQLQPWFLKMYANPVLNHFSKKPDKNIS